VIAWDTKLNQYRFSAFTLDSAAGVLRRNERYLRVPPQTLLLLTALLDRAGSVVSREELRQVLWPDGDVLEHDHAINRAVNYLRAVLRDNHREPLFIETLPKRGYRFIAPVIRTLEEEEPVAPLAEPESMVSLEASAGETIEEAPKVALLVKPSAAQVHVVERESPTSPAVDAKPAEAAWVGTDTIGAASNQVNARDGVKGWQGFLHGLSQRLQQTPAAYGVSALLLVSLAIFLVLQWSHRDDAERMTMGVLPFVTGGTDAPQLAGAMRADLTDTLSQTPGLQVHAQHSLDGVRQEDPNLYVLAKSLRLDLLLLVSLSADENQCALKVEVVRTRDGAHLASFHYTGAPQDLLALRGQLQRDILSSLHLGGKAMDAAGTENAAAYRDSLRAWSIAGRQSPAGLKEAQALYQGAIQQDPGFARAYAGLASAYLNLARTEDPVENLREAKLFAERARTLNPRVAEAHAVLAWVAMRRDWNTALCETEMRTAVELQPSEASYHALLAECLGYEGRGDEALREIDLARDNDPLWPQVNGMDVFVSGVTRQYERGIEVAWRDVAERPHSVSARESLAWSLFDGGRYEEAIRQWREMAVMEKDTERVALEDKGLAELRRGGPKAYAEVRLNAIEHHPDLTRSHPGDFAPEEWYAYVGDRDRAIAALEQVVARRQPSAINMAVNPMLDNLHSDPRYLSILNSVGLSLPAAPHTAPFRASLDRWPDR
jgi:DNA-binding winged helix-turn-helix (wHTH) protein/tetratricopeptide (TPR) repeat protein